MSRLSGALVLGLGVTLAAIAFGSRPLGVAGIGLLLAAGGARAWAGLVRGPVSVVQSPAPAPATEGERVRLGVEVRRASRMPVGSVAVQGRLGGQEAYECRLRGHGRVAAGSVALGRLPRGLYRASDVCVVLGDHLGLETVSVPVEAPLTVVVHPRLVDAHALFSDAGRLGANGRRMLLRRPVGFDFHSVREYEQGESLRRVHWPTTARRGQLMVKELEDSPRDAVAVVLDCAPVGAAGEPPDASFDTAVRAAGSVLRAYVARGRRATLVTTGRERAVVPVRALDGELRAALDALAAAEPDALGGLERVLRREDSALAAGELVVVTADAGPRVAEALLGAATSRLVSIVWVDAPSWVGRPTASPPGLLRLAAAGVPVAVVRRGDDLAAALGPPVAGVSARA